MQTLSSKQRPTTSPVPKEILTSSSTGMFEPQLTARTVDEAFCWKRLCALHAPDWQPVEGTKRLPLPVSKTTLKICAGVPICTSPKYAFRCLPASRPLVPLCCRKLVRPTLCLRNAREVDVADVVEALLAEEPARARPRSLTPLLRAVARGARHAPAAK